MGTNKRSLLGMFPTLSCFSIKIESLNDCIELGYGLDDRGSRVRFPAGAGTFSLHHHAHNGSGVHPASYPMGTRVSFSEGKAAGT
jgi:hypothetical protein